MPLNTARLRGTVCALPVLLMLNAAAPAQTRASDPGQTNAAQPPAMPAPIQDPPTAEAPAIQIDGPASQGSLNLGRVPKGWHVTVDGVPARVDDSGRFVFGIGRDATTADLVARAPHGATLERRVTVAARDWAIERIDGLPPPKVTPDPELQDRLRHERELILNARSASDDGIIGFEIATRGFRLPVEGRISGVFGSQRVLNGAPRSPHRGLDLAAPEGTPVLAPAGGRVVLVMPDLWYTGGTIMIDHGQGVTSIFAHLSETLIAPGQLVKAGDAIGRVGMTGRATGPHLHWGVFWKEVAVDPAPLVPALQGRIDPMKPRPEPRPQTEPKPQPSAAARPQTD
ncbi:M23 family metallopeptidase [Tistrella mobilis]|uniref:M23 family metallopeptidase n=1 Tax=Tistrella mobilis TaxID=171437 RepID=UPI003555D5B3